MEIYGKRPRRWKRMSCSSLSCVCGQGRTLSIGCGDAWENKLDDPIIMRFKRNSIEGLREVNIMNEWQINPINFQ